jgi:hypothetical protein
MPPISLSAETEKRIALLFPQSEQELVRLVLFEECGTNLPLIENADHAAVERIRFAALKLSGGQLDRLDQAIELAKIDWRDLLMAAGFGEDVYAHMSWLPEQRWR